MELPDLPPIDSTPRGMDAMARAAFHEGDTTWYAAAYDDDSGEFLGLIVTPKSRWLTRWTTEGLEEATLDDAFTPRPLSECLGRDAIPFDELTEGYTALWRGHVATVRGVKKSDPDPRRHQVKIYDQGALWELSRRQYADEPLRRAR